MIRTLILIFLGSLVSSCTKFILPPEFTYKEIQAGDFKIATWQKITNPATTYKIYIEGDGHAFNANGFPTNNPTPKSFLVRNLAANDIHENVIYIARPCQYIMNSMCQQKYWTTARFAPDIIEAEYQTIKKIVGSRPVVLVGFSGGAQIAGLIAVTKDLNTKKVITIAGNLDHKSWTEYHHLPSLAESINLADYKEKFALIPQTHYVGENDKVIPPVLIKEFISDKSLVHIVPDATHNDGWNKLILN